VIVAHLPAGYILARATHHPRGPLLWAALIGSVFPDIDMLWFHLVDHGAIHHHRYWLHAPAFWLAIAAVAMIVLPSPKRALAAMFTASVLIHLVVDTLAGGIMWLWPLSTHLFTLTTVPATQSHWVLSFMLHWTFLAELLLIAVAAGLLIRKPA
jgi:inner membrane protein